jgi:glucose-6-phosphate-specific signal transduction histidine kinase
VVVNLEIGADQTGGFGDGAKVASIEIDNGPAAPDALIAPGTSGGSGIQGMSARVRAVGGAFTALPASDGGFTVTATVPLRSRGRSA